MFPERARSVRRAGLLATALASAVHHGSCPICERTLFIKAGHWLRDR